MADIDLYTLTIPNSADVYHFRDDSKGQSNGVAELDANGKVPSAQLPSYVDDVIEVADYSHLPITGESGKIYVTIDDNKTYRWSGSAYVEISESLALGETSSTAYAGDKGKANADNITTIQGLIPSGATTSNKLATTNDVTGKVNKSGDTMTGNLTIQKDDGVSSLSFRSPEKENVGRAIGSIYKNTSSTSDNGTLITDYTWGETTKRTALNIRDNATLTDKLILQTRDSEGTATSYKIFGAHNSSQYTQNEKDKLAAISVNAKKVEASTTNGNIKIDGTETQVYDDSALWKSQGEYGVKNLNTYPYYETSHTDHNVVWTIMDDGSIKANGKATDGNSDFNCHYHTGDITLKVPNGTYIVSGCPSGGSLTTYYMQIGIKNSSGNFEVLGRDTGSGVGITINGGYDSNDYVYLNITCRIYSGYTADNMIFKPMLRLSADTDDTYRPYALTNKQLTDNKADKVSSATSGNLAGLDANGNLTDSGVSASSIGNLSGSHLGTCETEASTSAKIVTIGDGTWIPKEGDIIGVKFTYSNTALFVTLNVNGTGNKSIWYGDSVEHSGADYVCGKADSYIFYMYDGTYWIWLNEGQHDGNNFPSVAVYTASNQQVKIGTCNYYTLTNKSYCHFIFRYPNTCKDMLFMKINNSSSSKTIYINGEISSSTNYTLPAGTYIAYYEDDKWYFRTDGILPAKTTEGAEINERLDTTTTSISGNPISITGLKSNQLAVNPVITFEPIQAGSGDPSPVNERPISGYDKIEVLSCGKNLWDDGDVTPNNMSQSGNTYTNTNTDTRTSVYLRVQLLDGATVVRSVSIQEGIQTAGRYYKTVSVESGEKVTDIRVTHNGATRNIGATYNLPIPITKPCTLMVSANITATNPSVVGSFVMKDIQVELGSSVSTYQVYHKGTDISEPLPQTVYGGSLDVRTGKLTVTWGYTDLSTLTWTWYSSSSSFVSSLISNIKIPPNNSTPANAICTNRAVMSYNGLANGGVAVGQGSGLVYTASTSTPTPTGGIAYELATPFTIQLTPHEISLLKGYNYLSSNGSTIDITYRNGEIATLGDVSQLGETVNELGNEVSEINTDVDGLKSKISLSGTAINLSAWSNDSTANIAVTTPTKIFVVQISASGGISGNVITR